MGVAPGSGATPLTCGDPVHLMRWRAACLTGTAGGACQSGPHGAVPRPRCRRRHPIDDVAVSTFTRVRVLTFAAARLARHRLRRGRRAAGARHRDRPDGALLHSGVVAAALPAWLAAHQVPVVIGGLELGMLPLLPTALMMLIAARAASGAAERLRLAGPWQAGQAVVAIAVAHGGCGLAVALAVSGHGVSVDPLAALLLPGADRRAGRDVRRVPPVRAAGRWPERVRTRSRCAGCGPARSRCCRCSPRAARC